MTHDEFRERLARIWNDCLDKIGRILDRLKVVYTGWRGIAFVVIKKPYTPNPTAFDPHTGKTPELLRSMRNRE